MFATVVIVENLSTTYAVPSPFSEDTLPPSLVPVYLGHGIGPTQEVFVYLNTRLFWVSLLYTCLCHSLSPECPSLCILSSSHLLSSYLGCLLLGEAWPEPTLLSCPTLPHTRTSPSPRLPHGIRWWSAPGLVPYWLSGPRCDYTKLTPVHVFWVNV